MSCLLTPTHTHGLDMQCVWHGFIILSVPYFDFTFKANFSGSYYLILLVQRQKGLRSGKKKLCFISCEDFIKELWGPLTNKDKHGLRKDNVYMYHQIVCATAFQTGHWVYHCMHCSCPKLHPNCFVAIRLWCAHSHLHSSVETFK